MDVALSITGTLATLISVAIGLLSFTSDARLHRRIAKLRAVDDLMAGAPSPVILRALRMCLADLQARELLREKLRISRLAAVLLISGTIFSSLALTLITLGPVLVENLESDGFTTAFGLLMWGIVSTLSCALTTRQRVFVLRRDDYMDAYFHGAVPPPEQLGSNAAHITNHPRWKGALVTSALNTIACILCGGALGVLSFALLAPEFAVFYVAMSILFGAVALGIAAFGIASATESARSKIWPAPAQRDFVAGRKQPTCRWS